MVSSCESTELSAERNVHHYIDNLEAENKRLRAAVLRQVENIERWRETGEPAGPEESKSIYEQLCAAIGRTPVP